MHALQVKQQRSITRKDFLRGLWWQNAGEETQEPYLSKPICQQEQPLAENWALPPELRGPWLREEALRLGLTPDNFTEENLQKIVMNAMYNRS